MECCQKKMNVLWDSGSDVLLITHQRTKELGLKGRDVHITIINVGNTMETVSSKEYVVSVVDRVGVKWEITACGIDEITASVEVNMSVVSILFHSLNNYPITRPHRRIHLLIVIDYCDLMPQVLETNGDLQLRQNQFGYVVRRSHPHLNFYGDRPGVIRINHMKISNFDEIPSLSKKNMKEYLDIYFSIENLVVLCYPKCSGCNFGNCTPGQKNYSLKGKRE